MKKYLLASAIGLALVSCGAGKNNQQQNMPNSSMESEISDNISITFDADSAYEYIKRQVDFGPRVPNTVAHDKCADWLVSELQRHGASVIRQRADLKDAFGNTIKACNIFGQINPESTDRILLLAHYDTRPWADEDPDSSKHDTPIDGANDGASGVGVLLEVARQLHAADSKTGVDFLFLDAEDSGVSDDEDSWALGAQYFAKHLPVSGYAPQAAILLDMVGAENARFHREYFSQQGAPQLAQDFYAAAHRAGHGDYFPNSLGSAVNDDHIPLLQAGIPAIDIIDYRPGDGFAPTWHTTADNLSNISKATLQAVGRSLLLYLSK